MTDPASPASDLTTRFAAAVVMIAVALVAIYFGGWPLRILVVAAAAMMLVEYCDMHRLRRAWPIAGSALLAINLALLPELFPAFLPGSAGIWIWFGAAILFALLLGALGRSLRLGWGYAYVAIPAAALLALGWFGWPMLFWVMVVTWSTDIFAYFAGRSIGGPKLAPRISPNKTWAGLIGGMAGAALAGWMAASWFQIGAPFPYVGALMGLIAQLGDLYESAMKRRAGVKDSGSILPGHGGVLDRLDGLLPVAVASLALVFLAP